MKITAEKRPHQRYKLKDFGFVFLFPQCELKNIAEYVLKCEPDNLKKPVDRRRFHLLRRLLFVKDDEAAITVTLKFDKEPQANPNIGAGHKCEPPP